MYIGAVNLTKSYEYILDNGKIEYKEVEVVPGFIKIINEIIDNSVDVAIKSDFKDCNDIQVRMTDDTVEIKDNGTGIPILEAEDDVGNKLPLPALMWGHARAGSNFDDDENRTQIGMNGVGSFATNCFSKKFVGKTDDGTKNYTITFKNNAESYTDNEELSKGKTGVTVKFWPDLERFGIDKIDETHQDVIKQRLINLSMSFPDITFKFNGRKINVNSFKKYVQMFGEHSEIIETEDYKLAFLPNDTDDFKQFSYVNGLKIPDGGQHIDFPVVLLTSGLKDKLIKRFKNIKVGDIKNKMMVIAFLKNFKNTKFNSQAKEKITNSLSEMRKYYGDVDWTKVIDRLYKNKSFMDPVTEQYRIKEEMAKRKELKALNKPTKKVKSDKYLPSIGVQKYLMLVEGDSALGGLSPVLGRRECGYFVLRGKPLNAYSASQSKFVNNAELSDLYKVIQNENYEKIIYATDQDLDGFHIRGLLNGFFVRYLPELKGSIGMLQTPVIGIKKNKKLVRWHYSLNDEVKLKAGEVSKYYKGLGSHKESDLKHIVKTDGISRMIDMLEFDDDTIIDDWMGDDTDPRKKYLYENDFSIAKL